MDWLWERDEQDTAYAGFEVQCKHHRKMHAHFKNVGWWTWWRWHKPKGDSELVFSARFGYWLLRIFRGRCCRPNGRSMSVKTNHGCKMSAPK